MKSFIDKQKCGKSVPQPPAAALQLEPNTSGSVCSDSTNLFGTETVTMNQTVRKEATS